jgi:hypothetical protein
VQRQEEAEATGAASPDPQKVTFLGPVSRHGPYLGPHSLTSSRRGQERNFGVRVLPNPKIAIHLPRVPVPACEVEPLPFLLQPIRSRNRLGTRSRRSLLVLCFYGGLILPAHHRSESCSLADVPPRRAHLIVPSPLRAAWLSPHLGRILLEDNWLCASRPKLECPRPTRLVLWFLQVSRHPNWVRFLDHVSPIGQPS